MSSRQVYIYEHKVNRESGKEGATVPTRTFSFQINLSPFLQFKKMLTLSVRDAQWRRDGPVGADIVEWALDEAYVVKQRRSGKMVLLN